MTSQMQAQLYLADQRGCSQSTHVNSLYTLNYGSYFDESRKPVGALTALNDDTLTAGYRLTRRADQATYVIVIPVVGGLEFDSSVGYGFIQTGQGQVFSLATGMELTLHNPYETEAINCLQFWISSPSDRFVPASQLLEFDLGNRNELLPLFTLENNQQPFTQPVRGYIGKYDGRRGGLYQTKTTAGHHPLYGIFVFVLSGAFEVQNRLLQPGDGLALTDIGNLPIEFEALGNDAILFLIEIPRPDVPPALHPIKKIVLNGPVYPINRQNTGRWCSDPVIQGRFPV